MRTCSEIDIIKHNPVLMKGTQAGKHENHLHLHGNCMVKKKKQRPRTLPPHPPHPSKKNSHQLRSTELFTNHICRKPTNHRAESCNQKSCHPTKNGCKQRYRQLKYCNHYCNHNQPLHEKQCLILIILRCND